jgi:hypothetical protein
MSEAYTIWQNMNCDPDDVDENPNHFTARCDDCGDPTKRRKRGPHCGQLVCGWCWHHVHKLQLGGPTPDQADKASASAEVPASNAELTAFRLGLGL